MITFDEIANGNNLHKHKHTQNYNQQSRPLWTSNNIKLMNFVLIVGALQTQLTPLQREKIEITNQTMTSYISGRQ